MGSAGSPEVQGGGLEIFAPGGRIISPALLEQLRNTPPLSAEQAANLATFLSQSPLNKILADHIALYAVTSMVVGRQPTPTQGGQIARPADLAPGFEWADDYWDNKCDELNDSFPPACKALLALRIQPGIDLLIESQSSSIVGEDISYFAIGVSPELGQLGTL